MELNNWQLNKERFVSLLDKLIGETEHLQNWVEGGFVPREDLAAKHILGFYFYCILKITN